MTSQTLDASGRVAGDIGGLAVWYEFDDLTPFCQGYVEAALRELNAAQMPEYDFDPDWGVLKFPPLVFAFSALAPATLAQMIADCERYPSYLRKRPEHLTATDGERFWSLRQTGSLGGFAPLTLSLSDDGKVIARECGQ